MVKSKEWSLVWAPHKVRSSIKLFFLLCFYMEAVDRIAPCHDFEDEDFSDLSSQGIFRVLSNALYFLENREVRGQMVLFLGKLLLHQGLFPRRDICCFCGRSLEGMALFLVPDHGGFSCAFCFDRSEKQGRDGDCAAHLFLGEVIQTEYKDFYFSEEFNSSVSHSLFHVFFIALFCVLA